MAKVIKYKLCNRVNHGTEKSPNIVETFFPVTMGWSESAEEIAKKEAYNGEYTIDDDGQPEPEAQPSDAERIAELEEALDMLLNGVTE